MPKAVIDEEDDMTRNGTPILEFKMPALVEGKLTYLHGRQFLGRLVVLCFLPCPGLLSADVIDRQAVRLHRNGATLLIVSSGVRPFHRLWMDRQEKPWTPILADPFGKLHWLLGVPLVQSSPRCRTFVFDTLGALRLRVSHDFLDADVEALCRIVGADRPYATDRGLSATVTADFNADCLQS